MNAVRVTESTGVPGSIRSSSISSIVGIRPTTSSRNRTGACPASVRRACVPPGPTSWSAIGVPPAIEAGRYDVANSTGLRSRRCRRSRTVTLSPSARPSVVRTFSDGSASAVTARVRTLSPAPVSSISAVTVDASTVPPVLSRTIGSKARTNTPDPCRVTVRPSSLSIDRPWRAVMRATP